MGRVPHIYWLTQHLGDVPRHNQWLSPSERVVLSGLTIVKRRAEWRLVGGPQNSRCKSW